jgi:hypothetical protein
MGLRDEAAEPWGVLLGAGAGGLAWATGVPLPVAAAVGAAVWLTKVATSLVERRRRPEIAGRGQPLAVTRGASEAVWLERGRQAARSFAELAGSLAAGPLAEKVASMRDPVTETVATLERLAGMDPGRLAAEADRLADERTRATGEAAEYFDRALASVEQQRQVIDRLARARSGVLLRMESSVLELEGVVARLVELSALATGTVTEVGQLEQVADELEGVRRGLAEAEELGRRALRAYEQGET